MPVPAGPMPNTMSCVLDGFEIAALVAALGLDGAAAERTLAPGIGQAAQGRVGIGSQHAQHAVQVAVVEGVAGALQALVVGENLLGASHVVGRAFEFDGVRPQIDGDVEPVFQQAHILVPRAEQRLDVGTNPDAFLHSICLTNPCRDIRSAAVRPGKARQSRI